MSDLVPEPDEERVALPDDAGDFEENLRRVLSIDTDELDEELEEPEQGG
jgi:hypothetical protein